MKKIYNSTTIKTIPINDKTTLLLDVANTKKENVCLVSNAYSSNYKHPIFVTFVTLINGNQNHGFGNGTNLNISFKLTKNNTNQLTLIHPTLEEETFIYDKTIVNASDSSITSKIYKSDSTNKYIEESLFGTTSKNFTVYDSSFELFFEGLTVNSTAPNTKYKVKESRDSYWLQIIYDENYRVSKIHNFLSERECVAFTYSQNGQCSSFDALKDFNNEQSLTGINVSKVLLTYQNNKLFKIEERLFLSSTAQLSHTTSYLSNVITVTSDVISEPTYINLSGVAGNYYVTSVTTGTNTIEFAYTSNYKTIIQNNIDKEELLLNENYELQCIKTNDTYVKTYSYNLTKKHELDSISSNLYIKPEQNGTIKHFSTYTTSDNHTVTSTTDSTCPAGANNIYKVKVEYFDTDQGESNIQFNFNELGTNLDVVNVLIWYKVKSSPTYGYMRAKLSLGKTSGGNVKDNIANEVYFNLKSTDWNFTILAIQAKEDFDKVYLDLFPNDYPIEIDMNISLIKKSFINIFKYDSNGHISKYLTGKEYNYISFNKENKKILSKSIVNSYDENGRVISQITPKKVLSEIVFDQYGNPTSSSTKTLSGKEIKKTNTYNFNELLVSSNGTDGNIVTYSYDNYQRLKTISKGNCVISNTYYSNEDKNKGLIENVTIKENSSLKGKLEYVYNDEKLLASAYSSLNGTTKYNINFIYDNLSRISSVNNGNTTIYNCSYSSQDGQITSFHHGNAAKKTEFVYETTDKPTLHQLKQIKYAGNTKYSFIYSEDGKGNLKSILNLNTINIEQDENSYNYSYDNNNLLKTMTVAGRASTYYTNNLFYNKDDKLFLETHQYNTRSLQNQYVTSNKVTINSINGFEYSLLAEDNDDLFWSMMINRKQKVENSTFDISYALFNKNQTLFPYHAKLGHITIDKEYSYEDHGLRMLKSQMDKWPYNHKFDGDIKLGNKYSVFFSFVIPSSNPNDDIISIGNNNLNDSACFMINPGSNQLTAKLKTTSTIKDSLSISVPNLLNTIHFIAINVTHTGTGTNHTYSFDIYVDGEFKGTVSGTNNLEMDNIAFLSRLGTSSCVGDFSSVIIDRANHFTLSKIKDYTTRLKEIYQNSDVHINDFDMVIYGNKQTNDIIYFNHNFDSLNGIKPTKQSNNVEFTSIDDNFEYINNAINTTTGTYAYALKNQSLIYDFNLTDTGTVAIRTKFIRDELPTVLHLKGNSDFDVKIYLSSNNKLYANISGTTYQIKQVDYSSWYTVTISWSKYIVSSSLDTVEYSCKIYVNSALAASKTFETTSGTSKVLVSVGRTHENASSTSKALGYIDKLTYTDTYISDAMANNINTTLSKSYYCKNTYDDFGRKLEKDVLTTNNASIKKIYEYKLNNNLETTLLNVETLSVNGIEKNKIYYEWDDFGKVTQTRLYDCNLNTNNTKTYEYSGGQLTREYGNGNDIRYNYDGRGNLAYIVENNSTIKTFAYSADGQKLITYNSTDTIQYDGMFPKYYKRNGVTLKEYVFEGSELTQLIDYENDKKYTYYYNAYGLREIIRVTVNSTNRLEEEIALYYNSSNQLMFEERYFYEDNQFRGSCDFTYLYDCNNQLFGFKYNDTNYYYLRDALGNIYAIASSDGNIVAKYEYDAWGNHKVLTSTGAVDTSTSSVGNINKIRYKGYYYDVETQLFYCNSRYYSPELCRWISPDSIEYLDPQSINGLNLYCYCMNNPIMYADPCGHSAILFIVGLISSAVIGGLVSGGIAAGTAAISGGDIGAAFWGGFATGALSSLAVGVGMAIGGGVGLLVCGGMGFVAGFGGNILSQSISSYNSTGDISIKLGDAFFAGFTNSLVCMATMGSMNLWMSDSFNPALAGKTFGSRFVEFMSFDGANTVSSTFFGIMYGLFDGAASLTKYLIEQEISKPTTASAFNY